MPTQQKLPAMHGLLALGSSGPFPVWAGRCYSNGAPMGCRGCTARGSSVLHLLLEASQSDGERLPDAASRRD